MGTRKKKRDTGTEDLDLKKTQRRRVGALQKTKEETKGSKKKQGPPTDARFQTQTEENGEDGNNIVSNTIDNDGNVDIDSDHTKKDDKKNTAEDDDDDDDDYRYEDTESDDGDSLEGFEKDELAYLLREQHLDINDHQIPTLYYPSLENRLYTIMRSVKIEHIYTVLKWIIAFTSLWLLLTQMGQLHSTLRDNGYCDSRFNENGGMTLGLTTQLRISGQPCLSCPPHADCINGELFCKPLYRPYRSSMNKLINMVWPIGQQCTKDPIMINYAAKMERKMRDYLSRRQGEHQCRDRTLTSTTVDKLARLSTHSLVKTEASHMMEHLKHSFGLPLAYNQNHQVELDHLAELALDMVKKNKHVIYWEIDGILYLGTDIAKYSFLCWCWVTLCDTPLVVRYSIPVLALGHALLMLFYYAYRTWETQRKEVKLITCKALELLKKQRQDHYKDPSQSPGCSTSYLRQHAMDPSHENPIVVWNKVVDQLQKHPCLRHGYTDENGDLLQYFEWL